MTSNIGGQKLINHTEKDLTVKTDQAERKKIIMQELRNHFRPEFPNRVDDTVIFHTLKKEHMKGIIKIQIERLKKRLDERNISLKLAPKTIDFLIESGFDSVYGARPLKRAIQKELDQELKINFHQGQVFTKVNLDDSKVMLQGSAEYRKQDVLLNL